jgi:hypothetical protein
MSQEGSEKSAAGSSGSLLDELAYWIAAAGAGETAPAFNVLIHALGSVGVLALLEMPQLEHWVDSHVMGRRARL